VLERERHLEGVSRRGFVQGERSQVVQRPAGQVVGVDQVDPGSAAPAGVERRQVVGDGLGRGARGQELSKRMTSYNLGLDMFSLVSMIVGGFLIYNTFAMGVAERTRAFGVLRAIALTRRQVLATVLIEALLLAAIGSALGVLIGLVMAAGMSSFLAIIAGSASSSTCSAFRRWLRRRRSFTPRERPSTTVSSTTCASSMRPAATAKW
jgi:predicted lysophospholipase L1 biosynthesis ABC-type transport system permease subunit